MSSLKKYTVKNGLGEFKLQRIDDETENSWMKAVNTFYTIKKEIWALAVNCGSLSCVIQMLS